MAAQYWKAPAVGSTNSLGTLTVPVASGVAPLLSPAVTGSLGTLTCTAAAWDSAGKVLTLTYTEGGKAVKLTVTLSQTSAGLSAFIAADKPLISALDFGSWKSSLTTSQIAVPYYSSAVWYSKTLGKFLNAWWDLDSSSGSGLSGSQVYYLPRTDGARNLLGERLLLAVSADIDQTFPSPTNSASPYRALLAGRMVVDIWGGDFATIAHNFALLGQAGIANCAAILHAWQYAGYDNALPEHYPANPDLGGNAGLKKAIAAAKALGCRVALHENYNDYYPNYPGFTASAISLDSSGNRIDAWLNTGTGIQSFQTKPTWMVANAKTQSPLIAKNLAPTAGYLDVTSAAAPWDWIDCDAKTTGAAKLSASYAAHKNLWAYLHSVYAGPVFGEGYMHWFASGLLDGVEAQFGAGLVSSNLGPAAPLFVDFDLLKIHPLQVNHGMGYYDRWTTAATSTMTTAQSDAYRMQELAFGHAPFLDSSRLSNLPFAFTESNLVTPVAASYGAVQATSIAYRVGGSWVSSSAAAKAGKFTQLKATYANGLTVVANASSTALLWNGLILPQYGWAAQGAGVKAYTALCGSFLCDYAQTATSYFASARNQTDIAASGYAQPSVVSLVNKGSRSFAITYRWIDQVPMPSSTAFSPFVHFVKDSEASTASEGILFTGDHTLATPTTSWTVGQIIKDGPWTVSIPTGVSDGAYSIRIGLYNTSSGDRLTLSGSGDGDTRYIVGYLKVSNSGNTVAFQAPSAATADPRLNSAGSVVNFGPIQTDGMVSLKKSSGKWVLRVYPRYRSVTVRFKTGVIPMPSSVAATGGSSLTVTPTASGLYWVLPTNLALSYTWPAE